MLVRDNQIVIYEYNGSNNKIMNKKWDYFCFFIELCYMQRYISDYISNNKINYIKMNICVSDIWFYKNATYSIIPFSFQKKNI